jgi:hypothetical protein
MKSPLEVLNEVHEVGRSHPAIYDSKIEDRLLIAALVELDGKINKIQECKQDKSWVGDQEVPVRELTRGKLQNKMFTLLTSAGDKEQEVALQVYRFLSSLE